MPDKPDTKPSGEAPSAVEPLTADQVRSIVADELKRSSSETPPASSTDDPPPADREEILKAERKRQTEIRAIAKRTPGFEEEDELVEKAVSDGWSVDLFRAAVVDKIAETDEAEDGGGSPPSGARVGRGEADNVLQGCFRALCHRLEISKDEDGEAIKPDERSRPFRFLSLARMAEECLRAQGVNVRGLSTAQIADLALNPDVRREVGYRAPGYHTPGDFPSLLANVSHLTLRMAYEEETRRYGPLSRRVDFSDFKPVSSISLANFPDLEEVPPGGEYLQGTLPEYAEIFRLLKYGRQFHVTREAIINDDTDGFGRTAQRAGSAAMRLENYLMFLNLTSNPTMADGNALFSVAHANTAASGTALSSTTLPVAIAALRSQTGLKASEKLDLEPRSLIVGPAKEYVARQLTTEITPQDQADVNPYASMIRPIVTAQITGNEWFLGGDPRQVDMLRHGYLRGADGPMVDTRIDWNTDGIEIKCRHEFGHGAEDWRGFYQNDGE